MNFIKEVPLRRCDVFGVGATESRVALPLRQMPKEPRRRVRDVCQRAPLSRFRREPRRCAQALSIVRRRHPAVLLELRHFAVLV